MSSMNVYSKNSVHGLSIICIFCKASIDYRNGDRQNYVNHLTADHSINFYRHLVMVLNLTEKENLAAIIDMFGNPDDARIPDLESINHVESEKDLTKEDAEKTKMLKQIQYDKVEEEMEKMFREEDVDDVVKVSASNNNNNKISQKEIDPPIKALEEKKSGHKVQKSKHVNTKSIKNVENNKLISPVNSKSSENDEIEVIEVAERKENVEMSKQRLQMAKKSSSSKVKVEEGEVTTGDLHGQYLKCVLCNKIFLNQTYLRKHLLANHMESEKEPDDNLETVIDITEDDENICIDVDQVCDEMEGSTLDKMEDRVLENNSPNRSVTRESASKNPEDIRATLGITSENKSIETIEKEIVSLLGDNSNEAPPKNEGKHCTDLDISANLSLTKGDDDNIDSIYEDLTVLKNDEPTDQISEDENKQSNCESLTEENSLPKNSSEEINKSKDELVEDGQNNIESGSKISPIENSSGIANETSAEKYESEEEKLVASGDKKEDSDPSANTSKVNIDTVIKISEVGFKTVDEVKLASEYFRDHPKQIQKLTNHENVVDKFCDVDEELPPGWRVSKKTSKQGFSNKIYLSPDFMMFRARKAALEYVQLLKRKNKTSPSNSSKPVEDCEQTQTEVKEQTQTEVKSNLSEHIKSNKRKRVDVEDNILEKGDANTGDNDEESNIDRKVRKTNPGSGSPEEPKEIQIFQRSFNSAAEVKKVSQYFREHPKQIKRIIATPQQISSIFTDEDDDLPPGWRVGKKVREDGAVDKLYLSPDFMSFRSRKAVGEYIKLQIVVQ